MSKSMAQHENMFVFAPLVPFHLLAAAIDRDASPKLTYLGEIPVLPLSRPSSYDPFSVVKKSCFKRKLPSPRSSKCPIGLAPNEALLSIRPNSNAFASLSADTEKCRRIALISVGNITVCSRCNFASSCGVSRSCRVCKNQPTP